MKVGHFFNEDTSITIQDIAQSFLNEKIDILLNDYYHQGKVNTATSLEQEDVA
ncbi:hypothetical protein [Ectobacillus sp. sgz5001026]|uniref:hypothetical protein n=1 Tax=Ectobacillus sp. sgz5001026 TaxID=3242473 RepID=UPI0036D240F2